MKTDFRSMNRTLLIPIALFAGSAAHATVIDFVALTEGTDALGESAWSTLSVAGDGFNLDITATDTSDDDPNAFAYLDWNHAGLGVCGDVTGTGAHSNSGTNRCIPGSDDNMTTGETLSFIFDVDVIIDRIWFNNTHDPDYTIDFAAGGDRIWIGGSLVNAVGNGYAAGNSYNSTIVGASVLNYLGPFSATGGVAFDIGYYNEQFYISGMDVRAVPEPGTLGLLGAGLLGFGLLRRRRRIG
jgi:hypothetical protein